ncbi:MAG: hypothetical protein K6G38_05175 [Gammaproteobacteria bacterium]|nr:hypothetical protein [Gammaproteobacteria bacterium]
MYTVPIFLVTGYLDSGKSTFIKDTINNGAFDGKTLLLVAEQGEIEYDSDNLDRLNVHIEYFNSLEEFSSDAIQKLIKKYRPDQMFIEVNGMWDLNNIKFPPSAQILQTIYMIDGSTFPQYFANMTQSIIDSVKKASVVIFTKVSDPNRQVEPFKNSLKMANNNAQYLMVDENMKAVYAFEEPLPYDTDQKIIRIENEDFATFFIDTFEHEYRYLNKIIECNMQVFLSYKLPKGYVIGGRIVMNCCANDAQLCGMLIRNTENRKFKNKSWIHIKANITFEKLDDSEEKEPILTPIEIIDIDNPDADDYLDLRNQA